MNIETAAKRLVRHYEFCNGHTDDPANRRGMGPQSEWLELGPVEFVVKHVLPAVRVGWMNLLFHSPFGVGSFYGEKKTPIYEWDQAQKCRDAQSTGLNRVFDEFRSAMALIREAEPDVKITVYLGRFSAMSHHLAKGTKPGLYEMMKVVGEVLQYLDGCADTIGLDNFIAADDSEEFVLLNMLGRARFGSDDVPSFLLEPFARTSMEHLRSFRACINSDYFIEQLLKPDAEPFLVVNQVETPDIVFGRVAPGSPVIDVARDALKWSALGFAYGVQHHLAPVELSPFKLLEMGLA